MIPRRGDLPIIQEQCTAMPVNPGFQKNIRRNRVRRGGREAPGTIPIKPFTLETAAMTMGVTFISGCRGRIKGGSFPGKSNCGRSVPDNPEKGSKDPNPDLAVENLSGTYGETAQSRGPRWY